jgi:hypothetical protein
VPDTPSRRSVSRWLTVGIAVVFGGLLLGDYIIADRPLPTRLSAVPAPVASPRGPVPHAEELTPWTIVGLPPT